LTLALGDEPPAGKTGEELYSLAILALEQSNNCGASGVYGSWGTPAPGNIPGGRYSAVTWTGSNGNFWIFGGTGLDSTGTQGELNDLWKFNPATNMWTWMGGIGLNRRPAGRVPAVVRSLLFANHSNQEAGHTDNE
jgi:hypothetical protein